MKARHGVEQAGFALPGYFRFDRTTVRDDLFATSSTLCVKQRAHQRYGTNRSTIADHIAESLDLTDGHDLLDLGCGNGVILAELARRTGPHSTVTGMDVAPGVLSNAQSHPGFTGVDVRWVEGDVDDLGTFPTDRFDRITANYMFHYTTDFDRTLHEIDRMLRPGGVFLVTTDSADTMPEMYRLHFATMTELGAHPELVRASPKHRFSLENGPRILRRQFRDVRCRMYHDELRFPAVEPFMDFYANGYAYCCAWLVRGDLVPDEFFDDLHAAVERAVREHIDRHGEFVVTKVSGSLACRSGPVDGTVVSPGSPDAAGAGA
jgi:ubiquinone/menaquinone biosynthesis C-methylase UbiE